FIRAYHEQERAGRISPDRLLSELQTKGSGLTSPQTIRCWLRRLVLAPNAVADLQRIAEILHMDFVASFYPQIHRAARRLRGLHIALSTRLNRWLASDDAGSVAVGEGEDVIDAELGLTLDDFRHSLLRLRVLTVETHAGPFYRANLGRLMGAN